MGITWISFFTAVKKDEKHLRQSRISLLIGVGTPLAVLGIFKYYDFFVTSFCDVFHLTPGVLNLILPVGISFYTFQALSYTIDVYTGKIEKEKSFLQFALYLSFFPQLVAGPIVKASEFLPQLKENRKVTLAGLESGIQIFVFGMFKKVVLADNISVFVDEVYRSPQIFGSGTVALAVAAYAIQIYMDFSGYSDIAIGTAKLLGIKLMKNFDYPYISRNIAEFWRRWHISLTTWFRDYIYIPLGGSRVGKWKSVRNTFIIFLVSGFWHGANWTFICWGLFHALLFLPLLLTSSNRKYRGIVAEGKLLPSWKEAIQIGTTFFLVVIGWILFRAENMEQAIGYIGRLFSMQQSTGNMPSHSLEVGLYILLFWILEWFQRDKPYALQIQFLKSKSLRVAILTFVILFIEITMGKSSEFIYFQF